MQSLKSVVISSGSYLPKKIVSNDDLSKFVDTNDQWIVERTGIKFRHIADDLELTSDMATNAARIALSSAKIESSLIDGIIVATTTPDLIFPSVATQVQAKLELNQGFAFDIQAVCSGFIYAIAVADSMIKSGAAKTILIIGAEKLSSIVNWSDRGTCVLFGDGAGAIVLQAQYGEKGIIDSKICADGKYKDILFVDGGISAPQDDGKIKMHGQEVFKHAVEKMSKVVLELLLSNGLSVGDVNWLVPHQANIRILSAVGKKLGICEKKVVSTVSRYANTSAASIPLALDSCIRNGSIKENDLIALAAVGGGLTWGGCLLRL